MRFIVARAARVTGEMLERLVREKMAQDRVADRDCVICYGAGYSGPLPTLNANCSQMNKMEQGIALSKALKDQALEVFTPGSLPPFSSGTVYIARRIKHSKGRDIRVCKTPRGVKVALAKGRNYFTKLVPSDTEYRVWVYRRRVLCVYEKRLTEPELNTKFGRNRQNGWTFHGLESREIPESIRQAAVAAVRSLNLDFGAVDILGTREATGIEATVLEVNSAPGVSDEHRTAIVKLVNRIVRWVANNCPPRSA